MATAKATETVAKTVKEPTFTKRQLVKSKTYANKRDFLAAVLEDDKTYTKSEVENIILKDFYGGVK